MNRELPIKGPFDICGSIEWVAAENILAKTSPDFIGDGIDAVREYNKKLDGEQMWAARELAQEFCPRFKKQKCTVTDIRKCPVHVNFVQDGGELFK